MSRRIKKAEVEKTLLHTGVGMVLLLPFIPTFLIYSWTGVFCYALLLIFLESILQFLVRGVAVPNGVIALERTPKISRELVKKFVPHGFDPELGWIRKANTSKIDCGVPYVIDDKGSRRNTWKCTAPGLISTYGDSYAFCRECGDEETWQYYLSMLTGMHVQNFGVGNYGFDQSLIRLKRDYDNNPAGIVIIGVVPQTIARILSVWKHYNEYGNILAFKPRFLFDGGKGLRFLPCFIGEPARYLNLDAFIEEVKEYDFFYAFRFVRESFRFPFLISSLLNPHLILQALLKTVRTLLAKAGKKSPGLDRCIVALGVNEGPVQAAKLFEIPEATKLLEKLVELFVEYSREKGFLPVMLIMPMKEDLIYVREKGIYYDGFFRKISGKIDVVDVTSAFLARSDAEKALFQRWHYNEKGNRLVAEALSEYLRDKGEVQQIRSVI